MGSPLESATWNGVEGVYYVGAGSTEALWLYISIGLCVFALVVGALHERHAFKKVMKKD